MTVGLPWPALAQDGLVALVHTQAAGDSGPIGSMIAKLNQLSDECGFQERAVCVQDAATFETVFRTLGDAGASIIVATFPVISESVKAVAPECPDTKWIQLFGDPVVPPIPNLITVSYNYCLRCYLSGVFAANVSTTGRIGYIQTDAATTDGGIIQAANESPGRMVSALSPARCQLGPVSVISIVNLDFGQSLYDEVGSTPGPDWSGGSHVSTGIGTGVIEFERSPMFAEQGSWNLLPCRTRPGRRWRPLGRVSLTDQSKFPSIRRSDPVGQGPKIWRERQQPLRALPQSVAEA